MPVTGLAGSMEDFALCGVGGWKRGGINIDQQSESVWVRMVEA
jgi:hypothetical protein